MAEQAQQDESIMSVALYRFMCQKVVGSEDHVKTIRMVNTVRDNLAINEKEAMFSSGSYGEGLEMRGSDIDFMKKFQLIEVCENMNVPFNPDKSYFTMETSESVTGFTQLRLIHTDKFNPLMLCEEIGGEYYLSNIYIKQYFLQKVAPIIHGPCVSDEDGVFDIAPCLHSKSWITPAQQWITRSSNAWPRYDVKQSIIKHGVLFVPVGLKGSTKEELQWRTSFSVAEKLLVYTFTHTQLVCYAMIKILLKDVIDIDLNCKELLCSYFMKTILFWISEEFSLSIWRPENLISNFMRCVRRLMYCVENSICPHYFIPEINLFDMKIKGHAQETLLEKLNTLNSYGWRCILFSDQISYFNEIVFHIDKESRQLYVDSLKLILSPFNFMTNCAIPFVHSSLGKEVHMTLSIESSKIKYLYLFYMSKATCYRVQFLQFNAINDNKYKYKQYKTCINKLLLNIRHDAVTGWMMLASFFYKTKQYKIALAILQYSLLKCSPEKLYQGMTLSQIHFEIFSLNLFRQMTIGQLSKLLIVDKVWVYKKSTLSPDELQIEVNTTPYIIPPVVYAHFLCFLCHYHQNNTTQCHCCLCDLQLTIEEEYFMGKADAFEKAITYNILGITFQLIGDIESARHSFIKSIELESDPFYNTAIKRLSLIG